MRHLHQHDIKELSQLNRETLISLLATHDRDGEYLDEQRIALGEPILTFEQALNLAVINLNEITRG